MDWNRESLTATVTACNGVFERHRWDIKSFKDFYHFVESYNAPKDGSGAHIANMFNLSNSLIDMANAHINSVDDLRRCFKDLESSLRMSDADTAELLYDKFYDSDIARLLYNSNPERYAYVDRDRFYGMQIITDSDFIDWKSLDTMDYNVVYGILFSVADGTYVYDRIAHAFNEIKQPINRKSILFHWNKVFQGIIDGLESCLDKANAKELEVYIPFLAHYRQTASETIEHFKMAQDIVLMLRETPCDATLDLELPEYFEELKPMRELMEELSEDDSDGGIDGYYSSAVYNEMAKRGLLSNVQFRKLDYDYDYYVLKKSKKDASAVIGLYENEKETSTIRKVAVMYNMLKGKVDIRTMHRVAHFLIQDYQDFKGTDSGKATIYNYLKRAEKGESLATTPDAADYVREKLLKYGFKDEAKEV